MNPDKRRLRAKRKMQEGRVQREYRKLKRKKMVTKLLARPDVKAVEVIKSGRGAPDKFRIHLRDKASLVVPDGSGNKEVERLSKDLMSKVQEKNHAENSEREQDNESDEEKLRLEAEGREGILREQEQRHDSGSGQGAQENQSS